MSIHHEANEYGIQRPQLERYQYSEGGTTVIALTPESEMLWANYLRSITLAKIALTSQNASV